ncbi:MAG: DUF3352 domain-containing protein [Patescibacteria group bacterium]|nr:DUF3352 domain-containing protein [Patescibacteria group bacterium]
MPKKKTKKAPKFLIKSKLSSGIILFVILLAFSLLAVFMGQKLLEPTNLGKILPAEQTLGFITIDTTETDIHESYTEPKYEEENWFKGQFAIAYLTDSIDQIQQAQFFSYIDRKLLSTFLDETAINQEPYFNSIIYTLGENIYAAKIANYLATSDSPETIQLIIDSASGDSSNLRSLSAYNTIANNLPYNSTVVTYWDLQKNQNFIQDYVPLHEILPEELIEPVLSIFTAFGAAGHAEADGFQVQTYTAVQKNLLQNGYYFGFLNKYRADLAKYIPENPTFFWGGYDLHSELDHLETLLNQFHSSAGIIFEAILRGKVQEYFGSNTSLEEDVYPMLGEEFALAAYEGEYLALIALQDIESQQIHIDTLKKGFLEQQIYSDPYIQTYTLEDGSVGQELVADLTEISSSEMTYEGVNIDVFSLSSGDVLGYMTVFADNFVFATSLPVLEHSIDLMKSPNGSLAASPDMESINDIMVSADEASFIDLESLEFEFLPDFSSISSTKNLFNDGISTFHVIKY